MILIFWLLIFFFFFNDTATTEIYTLSLHVALPLWQGGVCLALPFFSPTALLSLRRTPLLPRFSCSSAVPLLPPHFLASFSPALAVHESSGLTFPRKGGRDKKVRYFSPALRREASSRSNIAGSLKGINGRHASTENCGKIRRISAASA